MRTNETAGSGSVLRRTVVTAVLVGVVAAGIACATPPKPKAPDVSRRTPVNKVVPPELGRERP